MNQMDKEYEEKCRVNPHKDKLIWLILSIDKRNLCYSKNDNIYNLLLSFVIL